jgi:hypothetical protein
MWQADINYLELLFAAVKQTAFMAMLWYFLQFPSPPADNGTMGMIMPVSPLGENITWLYSELNRLLLQTGFMLHRFKSWPGFWFPHWNFHWL